MTKLLDLYYQTSGQTENPVTGEATDCLGAETYHNLILTDANILF